MDQHEVERFRGSAKKWRQEAASAPDDRERNSCLQLAEGYERLVEICSGMGEVVPRSGLPDEQPRSPDSAPFN